MVLVGSYCIANFFTGKVDSMDLGIKEWQGLHSACGANEIEVKLEQGNTFCTTGNHGSGGGFNRGEHLYWTNFASCKDVKFDLDSVYINFYLKASSGDNYCPNRFSVNFRIEGSSRSVKYKSGDIDRLLDDDNNWDVFRAERQGEFIKNNSILN